MPIKEDISVNPPIPKKSLKVINRTIEYGAVPEIIIESDTRAKVTPHFFSAKRAEEEIIPTIAEGQPRLIAKVKLATFNGGPELIIMAIIGKAMMLLIKPTHARVQYPNTLSFIYFLIKYKLKALIYIIASLIFA